MVKNRHNHTRGLSEMLIEVSSALSFYSRKQGEFLSEFLRISHLSNIFVLYLSYLLPVIMQMLSVLLQFSKSDELT